MSIESNCFRINGLGNLRAEYRLFQIAGLQRETPEYYANVQRIVRQLSYQMKAPVTTYDLDRQTSLVVPKGFGDPPDHVTLVGAVAALKDTGEAIELNFKRPCAELDPVRLRFLQFVFQDPLWNNPQLWQPSAGKPFFFKKPAKQLGKLDLYEGFTIRVTPHPEGGFGITLDLRRKLVSRSALPANMSREQANKFKGRSCLYKMGHVWYEVSIAGLADLNIGEPSIPLSGKAVSLVDYLHSKSPKPVPSSIANLSPDGAAIYYRTTGPDQKAAPAQLCYLVEDTHDREGARHQPETVIGPFDRHRQIGSIVRRFLSSVYVGGANLSVSETPARIRTKPFEVPSLLLGNNTVLSLDKSDRGIVAAIKDYARSRLNLLDDEAAGFYERSLLDRQYIILPKSIANSSGQQFLTELMARVDALYPVGGDYQPELIVYDDLSQSRDFVGQSRAIKEAIEASGVKPGYALIMVHRYDRRARSADQLAAWVVKEFARQFEVKASVVHTDVIRKSYTGVTRDGETKYVVKAGQQKRLSGYLRNVALNKVLLANGKWPFVLNSSLHADVVIGIDVKNSTAAFTLIANGGRIIRFSTSPSKQKEQLLKNQVAKFVGELIRKESSYFDKPPKEIVIHRDGRAWRSEIAGLHESCRSLARDGYLDAGWRLTVLEIAKTAPAPLRLFNVKPSNRGAGLYVENPLVGSWAEMSEDEGFVCTTGKPFRIPGTANPLHVRRVAGTMPMEKCLSDVFSLSCLTWTRPEGAIRLPISIKLCDRSLFDEAAEYDEDAIKFDNDNLAGAMK